MRKIILASHGKLSEGMVDSVQMILGQREELSFFSLYPGEHPDQLLQELENLINAHPNDEFIVVTDILGGSVNNALMHLLANPRVHLITGMNLGLVITLCSSENENTEEMIHEVLNETKNYIVYANDLLKELL